VNRLGLNHDDLRTYQRTLVYTHHRRIHIHILDSNFNQLRSLTPHIVDGQVTVDVSADTTRMLTLSFLDPNKALAFEPDSPGPALWRNRIIRVIYEVRVPDLNQWIECPVFTGPVWDFNRQGALVNITAHGMEQFALGEAWIPRTYKAKTLRTDALKAIMGHVGEDCHAVPNLDYKLPHDFHVHRMQHPWHRAQHLAHSMNRYLFYDGHGTLHLRHHNDRPVFTFDDELLTPPQFSRTRDKLINTVEVLGKKPKGKKHRVRAVATAPGWMSPASLGAGTTTCGWCRRWRTTTSAPLPRRRRSPTATSSTTGSSGSRSPSTPSRCRTWRNATGCASPTPAPAMCSSGSGSGRSRWAPPTTDRGHR
jgi:hypothetical protein